MPSRRPTNTCPQIYGLRLSSSKAQLLNTLNGSSNTPSHNTLLSLEMDKEDVAVVDVVVVIEMAVVVAVVTEKVEIVVNAVVVAVVTEKVVTVLSVVNAVVVVLLLQLPPQPPSE